MATKAKADSKALNAELESALFSDVERLEMYFTRNWKRVVAVALAGVVAVTAAFAFHIRTKRNAAAVAEQLSAANSISDLEKAVSLHPQAPGVDMARYRLAGAYMAEKKYDQALKALAPVLVGADAALRDKARMTEAYALELSGKTAEAAQKFAALGSSRELSPSARAEASCNAGRLFIDLGRKDEAKAVLSVVVNLNIPAGSQSAGYWRDNAVELLHSID